MNLLIEKITGKSVEENTDSTSTGLDDITNQEQTENNENTENTQNTENQQAQ